MKIKFLKVLWGKDNFDFCGIAQVNVGFIALQKTYSAVAKVLTRCLCLKQNYADN